MANFSVTVVIPVWNQWELTKACLETLRPTLGLHDNVIVVDNGSEDFTAKGLKQFPWLTVITNDTNLGFSKACNQGAAAATGDVIVFLNNDTVLTSRWLDGLTAPFKDNTVSATGPRSNFVSGLQLVENVGYTMERMSDYRQWVKTWTAEHKGLTTEVERLVGFCLAVRRTSFEQISGFDEQFGIGSYEDDDLCRRLIAAGGRLLICHDSFVHHVGHGTFDGNALNWQEHELENRKRYRQKHNLVPEDDSVRPLVSACMIVKDEFENLPRCLESLSDVVDEVVIYDTGSTDGSIEMARQAGARVIEGFWDDDFGRARNEALANCKGEWILHIDADEEFDGDASAMRNYLAAMPLTALQLPVLNVTDDNKNNLTHRPLRLFKNDVWHWIGRIHEQVKPRFAGPRPNVGVAEVGGLIHHGYTSAEMERKGKAERNVRIARLDALDDNGRDAADKLSNLGRSLTLAGETDEAMLLFRQARLIPTDSPVIKRTLLRSGAQAAIDLGLAEEALDWVAELERESTHKDSARYFRGLAYAALEEWELSLEALEGLEDMKDDDGVVFPKWIADVKRAIAYASLGRWDQAVDAITPAAFEEANDEAIWALVAEAYWHADRDLDQLFASIPAKQLSNAFAQLAAAPAPAADKALESLWKLEDRRNSVLALAIRTAPHLAPERALEWSVRLHSVGLSEHCPLIALAWDTNRNATDRIRAAAIASAVNNDVFAVAAVKFAATVLPKNDFEVTLYQVHELAPALLEHIVMGASTLPNRSVAMGQALYSLGADAEGIAVLLDGLAKGADSALVEEAAKWLETVGHAEEAATIRLLVK